MCNREKKKILVTRKIPQQAMAILQKNFIVDQWEEEDVPIPRDILLAKASQVEGIYSMLTDRIDVQVINNAPHLKIVSNLAVGYDNIDVATCSQKNIMVTNTPDVLNDTTADLTIALLLATARRITEASEFLKKGQWKSWSPMQLTGQDVYGATLGIIGMGRIGEAVAKRVQGFDMKVLYYNRNRKLDAETKLGAVFCQLDVLLKESDFVVILAPLTPETKNLIGSRELNLMKPTSCLINCGRGGIVNEHDLYEALKEKKIWACGLDVYEQEPIHPQHPLLTLDNVVLLPHIGSASIQTRTKMAIIAAENLTAGLTGEKPANLLTPVKDVN